MTTDPIFSKIAARYDLINRVLSFGRDQAWRRTGAEKLPDGLILDLGAGTGAARGLFGDRRVVALDPVGPMLAMNAFELLVAGYGEALPFGDETFEGAFSAYVVRNLESLPATLEELRRVLKPGGLAVMVDLGRPRNPVLASLHRAGSAVAVPLAGAFIGARAEYAYLNRSLDKYPQPEELYADQPLALREVWRMGPFGFVYGVVLEKAD